MKKISSFSAIFIILISLVPNFSKASSRSVSTLPNFFKEYVASEMALQEQILNEENNSSLGPISRIQLQTFSKVGFKLLFLEVSVKPTLEFRWNRKNK